MKTQRLPTGHSDPVSFSCTCKASSNPNGGLILLFYRYFAASPALPKEYFPLNDPSSLVAFQTSLTEKHALGGKIRVAKEGFNITVGGTEESIEAYMRDCMLHWSFAGLHLDTKQKQRDYFKPNAGGCACAFGGTPASVRLTAEITPMGVTNYSPENWDNIEVLSPEEFHEKCYSEPNILLVDTRNHYESRIGYFVDPKTGEPALRPPIRRFSQWPQYVRKYMTGPDSNQADQNSQEGRQIMTFCTGGIRCEKGARYMEEKMTKRPGDQVCTLKGGIAAYITWMVEEISKGRKLPGDSLFKGRNYVFDARGSTGLEEATEPVSKCHECGIPSARLSKCRSQGCHLVLVICQTCEDSEDPRCCKSCLELDITASTTENLESRTGPRPICLCEMDRETQLWGERTAKVPKVQKSRAAKDKFLQGSDNINIQVATFS